MVFYHKWFVNSGSHKLTAYLICVRKNLDVVFIYTGYCICPNRILDLCQLNIV